MNTLFSKVLVCILCFLVSTISYADEVILHNGDKLSGTIITKTGDTVTLETHYAGEIEILWSEVKSLSIDKPSHVVLKDGTDLPASELSKTEPTSPEIEQIAAINPPVKPDFINKGQINFGLELDRGNSDVDDYHLDSETEFRWTDDRLVFELSGDLEDSEGTNTKQDARFLSDYDHFLSEKLFTSTSLLLEHEKFADLNLRTTLTAGFGYQIFENPRMNLFVEAGPGYIWEDFDESQDEDFPIAFWALQFDQYLFKKWKLQAFHDHRYSQSFEESSDFIFTSSTGLRIPLSDNLQATIQYNFDWDNTPSDNADEDDHETLVTAGYVW